MSDDPAIDRTLADMRETLALASLVISSFRWRLRSAGFPFREPVDVDRTLARIDALVYPEETSERAPRKNRAQCKR
jgi:hypothetical protein